MKPRELNRLGSEFNSIYLNNQSFQSALLAAGGCFNAVEKILSGEVRSSQSFCSLLIFLFNHSLPAFSLTYSLVNLPCHVTWLAGEQRRGHCPSTGPPR